MRADINHKHPFSGKTPLKEAKDKGWLLVVELLNHWEALEDVVGGIAILSQQQAIRASPPGTLLVGFNNDYDEATPHE